ncbi:MAG: hypothetical protein LBQ31_04000 [Bacteroidales bacterium]|jgi:predicted Fe-S protein YdhL (DUF1289 family)|nr:hypothetical protein [Bacteroidales bacterium]
MKKEFEKRFERKACRGVHKFCWGAVHCIFGVAAIAAFGAVVMCLWNCLVPDIFGLTTLTFWQAIGLFVLARILFGGFCGMFKKHGHHRHCGHHHHNPIREKWLKMTPEERKEFWKDCNYYNRSDTTQETEAKGDK